MNSILLTGNHALRCDQEYDWATNIGDAAFQSFTFHEYDDQGKPIRVYEGIIKTDQLCEVLLAAGLLKKEDIGSNKDRVIPDRQQRRLSQGR